jgi:hypothetical protein
MKPKQNLNLKNKKTLKRNPKKTQIQTCRQSKHEAKAKHEKEDKIEAKNKAKQKPN